MTHSVQGVCACVCVLVLPNVLPILFHEFPGGPWRGSLLRLQVYLKLCLVYLMNGCLSKEQGGSVQRASRTLMCVFKGENREVVINVSTDTVIRKLLLPWQMRYKSTSADPPLVQQPVDTQRHADGWKLKRSKWPELCGHQRLPSLISKSWGLIGCNGFQKISLENVGRDDRRSWMPAEEIRSRILVRSNTGQQSLL